jgi:CRP/FNR family cyclic AMP-dependent transcriptional regulator
MYNGPEDGNRVVAQSSSARPTPKGSHGSVEQHRMGPRIADLKLTARLDAAISGTGLQTTLTKHSVGGHMAPSPAASTSRAQLEDPLDYLPCSRVLVYKKAQVIYNQNEPATNLYLVIDGKVKISRLAADGHQVIMNICRPDDFFGESAFLRLAQRSEQATAWEDIKLMTWTTSEVEDVLMRRPRLAGALLQMLAQRTTDFTQRLESFSVDNIARRLARSLIRLSERLGTPEEDGSVRMAAFTHELLSQYVGTSREIVTHYMNQFRRQGYLRYSRKGIILYREAFHEWLQQPRGDPTAGQKRLPGGRQNAGV